MMTSTADNYHLLIDKLDRFIRKYYFNRLLRGILYFIGIILSLYLIFSLLEYSFAFNQTVRKVLFFFFLLTLLSCFYFLLLKPGLKYFKLGKIISHHQAAIIVGEHFPEVQDRLLNILQLKNQALSGESKALIHASIEQKISQISWVPFPAAVELNKNRKYLKYALAPLLVFLLLLFTSPSILRESNYRLIHNNIDIETSAPFQFHIVSKSLETVQYQDFDLEISVSGDYIPEEVMVLTDEHNYRMYRNKKGNFIYHFKKLRKDIAFQLEASGFRSNRYTLKVYPVPAILDFNVKITYPAYLHRKTDLFNNNGNLVVPEGSIGEWILKTQHVSSVEIKSGKDISKGKRISETNYTIKKRLLHSGNYTLLVNGERKNQADSIEYSLSIISDQYPEVFVHQYIDSIARKYVFFSGGATDDYGLTKLSFFYKIERPETSGSYTEIPINIKRKQRALDFNYNILTDSLGLKPGDRLYYYFSVWDNDGVNGAKMAKTATMQFKIPTAEEQQEALETANKSIKNKMAGLMKESDELKKETALLREKILQKKQLSWEDKQSINDLLQKQASLQNELNKLQNELKNKDQAQKNINKLPEDYLKKQEQLEKLLDQLLDDELKDKLAELQKMLDELDPEKTLQEMEKFQQNNDLMEKDLDRALEMFKQMEFEQALEKLENKLDELANRQEKLADQTEENTTPKEKLLNEQDSIKKDFDRSLKDLEKLENLNKNLKNSKEFPDLSNESQEAKQDMDQSSKALEENKKNASSKAQKSASKSMKEMQKQLSSMMSGGEMEQTMIDIKSTRQLLENLMKLSFDQEALFGKLHHINTNTPAYVQILEEQQRIKRDTKMVSDSLEALSTRVFQISTFVNRELLALEKQLNNSLTQLADRKPAAASSSGQYVMTHYNNLALMLDEVLRALQQQMSSMMPGNQMCQNPSSGPSKKGLGKMQEQLNKELNEMKKQLESGSQAGQSQRMSEQLAKLAARQSAIRQALQGLEQNNKPGDNNISENLNKLKQQMDQTEEDLVNRRITEELLNRQKEILVRLLEAENADRQRKESKERESQTAKETTRKIPAPLQEYIDKKEAFIELYKSTSPNLKPFYKNVVENYFKGIQ